MADYSGVAPSAIHAGAVLRQAREARRLSVDDVAQALKLTPKQIMAIENEEFDLLPGKTFARGFVRNYARLLQLDPTPLLAAVEVRIAGGEVDLRPLSNAAGRMPAGTGHRGVPRILLVGLLLAVVALAVGVYLERFGPGVSAWHAAAPVDPQAGVPVTRGRDTADHPVSAPAPEVATPIDMPAAAAPAALPAATPAPEAGKPLVPGLAADATARDERPGAAQGMRRLVFRFGKESWLEVRDGTGKVLTSRLNAPGSTLEVEGLGPFALVVGNAASVELTLDGRSVDLRPHTSVSVARLRLE